MEILSDLKLSITVPKTVATRATVMSTIFIKYVCFSQRCFLPGPSPRTIAVLLKLMGHSRYSIIQRRASTKLPYTGCALCIFVFLLIYGLNIDVLRKFTTFYAASLMAPYSDSSRPPEYTNIREWEKNLPQHNIDLPYPEGRSGRYVLFSNSRVHLSGWNNKLNDMYVSANIFELDRSSL